MKGAENRKIRWWPMWVIWGLGIAGILLGASYGGDVSRQQGVMRNIAIFIACLALSLFWLILFSRLVWRKRIATLGVICCVAVVTVSLFRYEGVSGDLIPILKWRWSAVEMAELGDTDVNDSIFAGVPQFLGPNRNATVTELDLSNDWATDGPKLILAGRWEAWSGFAISGINAVTQEQRDDSELVTCYHLLTGKLWESSVSARYDNALGGVGPGRPRPSMGACLRVGRRANLVA